MPKQSTPTKRPTTVLPITVIKASKQRAKKPTTLLKGWRIYTKTRKAGNSKGKEDKYYISPSGKTFRSKRTMNSYIDDHTPVSELRSNGPQPQYQKWITVKQGKWMKEGALFQ